METAIEIRDLRQQDWIWVAKALLFHPQVDEKMYKVYNGLASYANNYTQKAFPGIVTLTQKLHMSRSSVLRSITNLEQNGFIKVERTIGSHNVYTLLDIPTDGKKADKSNIETIQKPSEKTLNFFIGISDLVNNRESEFATQMRSFLVAFSEKYPNINKSVIWSEIKKFERYWTELNQSGTKARWQKEKTFEVDRRLAKWFDNNSRFKKVDINSKGNKVIV